MRVKCLAAVAVAILCGGIVASAATLRVVAVETSDAAAYLKAIEQGQALLKSKGSPAILRVWKARFAGEDAGQIVVSVEYPNLEALAKDDAMMAADADVHAWLLGLDKIRKVVSDSIYTEIGK
ncbi:MAG: hypothetical protein U0X73_15380 [Thermoanaerobaculia bacterium]